MIRIFRPDRADEREAPPQPGTLLQQFLAIAIFMADESRHLDREAAWNRAMRDAQRPSTGRCA